MSQSLRAKERRSKRSRLSKHDRYILAAQTFGEQKVAAKRQKQAQPISAARRAFQDV